MPPGPAEPPAAFLSLAWIASVSCGSSPTSERAQLVDRMAQRAGQRAAEIGDADALGAAIGADPHPDDRALAVGVGRGIGQRLVGRQIDDAGADRGDFHGYPRKILALFPSVRDIGG